VVRFDGQLKQQLEVFGSVLERTTDPRLEAQLIVGHVPAARKPSAVQPVQCAQLQVDPTAHHDFGHEHRGKLEPADIRDLQKQLKADGLTLTSEADEATTGPASLTLVDPDGNMILLDQHR